jgi:hypothetical protein
MGSFLPTKGAAVEITEELKKEFKEHFDRVGHDSLLHELIDLDRYDSRCLDKVLRDARMEGDDEVVTLCKYLDGMTIDKRREILREFE